MIAWCNAKTTLRCDHKDDSAVNEKELQVLRTKLESRLKRILAVTHAEVDAEYVRMAAEVSRFWRRTRDSTPRFHESKKRIQVELDLDAVDVILALGRIVEGTYGICLACRADLPYELLDAHPTESLCTHCRESVSAVSRN